MKLAKHLQRYADTKYADLKIHPDFLMEDRYVFTTNRLLAELNLLATQYNISVKIINIEYDNAFSIPRFILVTDHHSSDVNFKKDLEMFFERCHIEFIAAFMKSYF